MEIVNKVIDFLLSEWLWGITFDLYHVVVNTVVLLLLIKFILRKNLIRSILLSFSAQFFSFMFYSLIVIGIIHHMLKWEYIPGECSSPMTDPLYASLALALIHAILQSIFFGLIKMRSKEGALPLIIVTFISNTISALLSYSCIMLTMSYLL